MRRAEMSRPSPLPEPAAPSGALVVTMRRVYPLEEKICLACGRPFQGTKLGKYCSRACNSKASYYRHAEARRQARRARYRLQREREQQREQQPQQAQPPAAASAAAAADAVTL